MKSKDALNPTDDEQREWAQAPDAEYPDEMSPDWEPNLTSRVPAPALIGLCCEDSPNREFFRSRLYTLSGDAVKRQRQCERAAVALTLQSSVSASTELPNRRSVTPAESATHELHQWVDNTARLSAGR